MLMSVILIGPNLFERYLNGILMEIEKGGDSSLEPRQTS
jgi:hypothetical protein